MNKKTLIIIAIIIVAFVSGLFLYTPPIHTTPIEPGSTEQTPISDVVSIEEGKYCFARTQGATADAPYSSEEYIAVTIANDSVNGTKEGTQHGPGMSNGFTGVLHGSIKGTELELLYSYIVEGSEGKELEFYTFENTTLVKSRWPLIEKDGILAPNKDETPSRIIYGAVECK